MQIIKSCRKYLDQLIDIIEEYRSSCGFEASPAETKRFFLTLMEKKESVIFLAINETSETVMGFVNLYPSYSTLSLKRLWILNDLGVSREFRGQGIAKELINEVLSFARETKAVRVELKTQTTNLGAQNLYKSLGFEVDDENVYYRIPI